MPLVAGLGMLIHTKSRRTRLILMELQIVLLSCHLILPIMETFTQMEIRFIIGDVVQREYLI